MQNPNYYEILGINPEASQETIKERLNSKTKESRSLTNSRDKEVWQKAIEELKILADARYWLLDSQRQKEYNSRIRQKLIKKEDALGLKELIVRKDLSYSIVLMLDTSGSMYGKKIEDARDAIISFLEKVSLAENEVGLVTFGANKLAWTNGLTQEGSYMEREIRALTDPLTSLTQTPGIKITSSLPLHGGTPMMQAIKIAHEKVLSRRKAKAVMIIATDGLPTDAPQEEILRYSTPIKKDGTWIITIGIGDDVDKEFLEKLATCPDDYYFAKASFQLKMAYEEVASVLR